MADPILSQNDVKSVDKSTVILNVDHVRQKYAWDCGLACVTMIIKNSDARRGFLSKQKEILMKEELQTSVWTIDLVYILKTLNIECWYYTETVGVNHDYKDEPYYRQSIDADTLRVTKKFNDAESNGIRVSRRVLTLKNILCHLETDPIIALLDAKYAICCEITHSHKIGEKLSSSVFRVVSSISKPTSYHGHYVVLVGYDSTKEIIYYNDPNLSEGFCHISYESFEKARTSKGTDQDLVLVKGFSF
ncbi:hypothetical protein CHUAL_004512 [Chamberlinius hualienensis]